MTQDSTAAPSPQGGDRAQIDRRAALKAALGGAAVAAVFVAPRIEGFSLAPDYAAAGTQCHGPTSTTNNTNYNAACVSTCWGSSGGNAFNCNNGGRVGGCASKAFTTLTANNVGPTIITLNGNISGRLNSGGAAAYTLAGMEANDLCNVNLSGTCSVGAFNSNTAPSMNQNFAANGSSSAAFQCNNATSGTLTVTLTCTC
ncbi:MAG: hypothetical protein ABIP03_15840 [Aquihabitans sp.]